MLKVAAALGAALVGLAVLSGCAGKTEQAPAGQMPADVSTEFNQRMRQGGQSPTGSTPAGTTNPGYPGGVPTGPGR